MPSTWDYRSDMSRVPETNAKNGGTRTLQDSRHFDHAHADQARQSLHVQAVFSKNYTTCFGDCVWES